MLLIEPGQVITVDYLKKVNEKLDKIKFEAYEKMKRKAMFYDLNSEEGRSKLVKVQVEEINSDHAPVPVNIQKKDDEDV